MGEQRNVHTTGIILKKQPIGENDVLVTLYSPELGKIQAAAKGARKMTSSFSGHIETLNMCNVQLYKTPVRYTLIQCQTLESFKNIREDFERSMMAGLIIEIFHKSTLSTEHAPELFHLLKESLQKLCISEQHFLTVEAFKLNLLRHIGVLPNLENCGSCHRRWKTENNIWMEINGHLQCHDCYDTTKKNEMSHRTIDFNIIKLIHYLVQPINNQTKKIAFNAHQKEQLQHITRFFLEHFLDREILGEKILLGLH